MKLSIVIPVHNRKDSLKRCVDSLFLGKEMSVEIIVVDDASGDDTMQMLRDEYPHVRCIRNEVRLGACASRNRAINEARGEYIMIMDSDTVLAAGFIEELFRLLGGTRHKNCCIAPKIIDTRTDRIFSCGLCVSSLYRSIDVCFGKIPSECDLEMQIDGPNSCCAIFPRRILEKVKDHWGVYDERFFIFFEDTDLALRLNAMNAITLYEPRLICYHYAIESRKRNQEKRHYCFRNRMLMIAKHNKGKKRFLFFTRSFFYDFFRTIHFLFTNKYAVKTFKEISKNWQ